MSFDAGSAVGKYILDIADAERKAAELRSLFAGIRQEAAQATGFTAPTSNASAINQTTTAIKQQTAVSLELAGARSREAMATGNVTQALAIYDGAMGSAATQTNQSTEASLRFVQAEARALQQVGQYRQAIELLESSLEKFSTRTITVINAERQLTAIEDQAIAVQQREADSLIRLAQAQARAQVAAGNRAGALRTLEEVETTGASERVVAGLDTQVASLTRATDASQQFGQAVRNNLLSIVGPAAAAAAVFQTLRSAVDATEEGFRLRAALDAEQRAAAIQLAGLRDTTVTFDRANAFAGRYGLTQEQVSEAISDSIPVIRRSKSSIEDILSVFTRLTILKPGKTFNDAARAIGELQSGQLGSLERIFNVSAADAQRMKQEIDGGADAMQVLNKFLTDSNVGMEALETRTKGVAGLLLESAQVNEQLRLAAAGQAGGLGETLAELSIGFRRGVTRLLGGEGGLGRGLQVLDAQAAAERAFNATRQQGATETEAVAAAQQAYNAALAEGNPATQQATQGTELLNSAQTQEIQNAQVLANARSEDAVLLQQVGVQTDDAAQATQRHANALAVQTQQSLQASVQSKELAQFQATLANLAGQVASGHLTDAQAAAVLARQYSLASGEAARLIGLQAQVAQRSAADILGEGAGSGARRILDENNRVRQAQFALDLARAKTAAQRIAVLQREQAATTDVSERLRIQAQIESERNSSTKAHTSELTKQLNLEEKIRDSKEAQLKASIDARKLDAQDRLDRLKEDQELAQARRVLANSHDERFRQAAQARIDLIGAERDSRALALQQAQATAGGTIVNGRVFQSIPSAPGVAGASPAPVAGGRPTLTTPTAQGGSATGGVTLQLVIDGKVVAEVIEPRIIAALRNGRQQSASAGGAQS